MNEVNARWIVKCSDNFGFFRTNYELSKRQEGWHDSFVNVALEKRSLLLSSSGRKTGKTITMDECCFTLQALGFEVLVLTINKRFPYCAHDLIEIDNSEIHNKLDGRQKVAIVVDEFPYRKMFNLLSYCDGRNIPVIGYVDFIDLKESARKEEIERGHYLLDKLLKRDSERTLATIYLLAKEFDDQEDPMFDFEGFDKMMKKDGF